MNQVTVIIPVRNAEHWLRGAVESALACRGVSEVIVIDDSSIDGSRSVAREFGSRIILVEAPAAGGNAARNHGLNLASGEWVQFLDADDYLEPQKIERQLQEASGGQRFEVLYSPVWIETWRNGVAADRSASPIDPAADLFTQWITWQLPQTGGALWRKESLLRLEGWKEGQPCCQEHELYLRALQAGLSWKYCPSPGAVYRIWSEETVCRRDPVLVIETRTELIKRMLFWLGETRQLTSRQREAAEQAFFEMARTWAGHDLDAAGRYLKACRVHGPIKPTGPAAPWAYRAAFRLFGFRGAETLARVLR